MFSLRFKPRGVNPYNGFSFVDYNIGELDSLDNGNPIWGFSPAGVSNSFQWSEYVTLDHDFERSESYGNLDVSHLFNTSYFYNNGHSIRGCA